MTGLRTSQVARAAGVSIQTLRFYEREGILPVPRRSRSGYRLYTEQAVQMIRLVKRAQELGFTLREVRGLLDARATRRREAARGAASAKISEIEEKIRGLMVAKRSLRKLLKRLDASDGDPLELLGALERDVEA